MHRVDLHDATLVGIVIGWAAGTAVINLWISTGPALITCEGLSQVNVARHQPWGQSASVDGIEAAITGSLNAQMQSGDLIQIDATRITLPG